MSPKPKHAKSIQKQQDQHAQINPHHGARTAVHLKTARVFAQRLHPKSQPMTISCLCVVAVLLSNNM